MIIQYTFLLPPSAALRPGRLLPDGHVGPGQAQELRQGVQGLSPGAEGHHSLRPVSRKRFFAGKQSFCKEDAFLVKFCLQSFLKCNKCFVLGM